MLGFTESFATGYPCRICKNHVHEMANLTKENEDCIECDATVSGIKEKRVFHKVEGFHICVHCTLDLMHDLFEGVNSTLVSILDDLIYIQEAFSLNLLNTRLQSLDYTTFENANKIPEIKREHIVTKKKLKMSASEMINFCKYLGILIGDKVSEENEA